MRPGQLGAEQGGRLVDNLVLFGQVLRRAGIQVSSEQIASLVTALDLVDIGRAADFRHACRAVLVYRREHLELFDRLFDLFWRAPRRRGPSAPRQAPVFRRADVFEALQIPVSADAEEERDEEPELQAAYSPLEVLRRKDFAELTPEEADDVRRLMAGLVLEIKPRRTRRRVRARRGADPDMRRSVRESLRYGGEPLRLAWRRRKTKPRPLVMICDVSASMEIYSRLLLQFIYAVGRAAERLEAFVFGTRLTRVTRQIRRRDVRRALREAAEAARDWGGGTRIGACLKDFNYHWGRRVLGQGATVVLISDGWDRGDAELLRREMGRLRRSCHRLIWLNPLLGSPDYEPLTRGMRTALPFVDEFLPVHNLRSLEQLARVLGS